MGALWQTVAYIFRILSILNPASLSEYAAWFVLILVSVLDITKWPDADIALGRSSVDERVLLHGAGSNGLEL